MSATEYLFAVQDGSGREVCSGRATVEKVSTVQAVAASGVVRILHGEEEVATGRSDTPAADLAFLRWPADDKLSEPVSKQVVTQ